jgi:hypothetical protein
MRFVKSISGIVILTIFLTFILGKVSRVNTYIQEDNQCLCAYDGFGYYMYLPHLFQFGNLNIDKDWAQQVQNKYCSGIHVYQLEEAKNGNSVDIYHLGQAFLELPAYTIAEGVAIITGHERDGFTLPYFIMFHLNSLLFIFLGLHYLRKLLLLFVSDKVAAISIGILYLASNTFITFNYQYDLPHLYLFALNAISIYHVFKFEKTGNKRSLYLSAIIFGLTVCIRPTQAIMGIIPLFILLRKHKWSKQFWKQIGLYPLFAFVWNIPQIIYWWTIGGEPFMLNLHTEDIVLTDPNLIDFLFSYRKGWLLYSPIFALVPAGLYMLYRKDRTHFYGITSFIVLYIYVMSSWECWWYANSFGSRVMVDIYPIVGITFALFIQSLHQVFTKIVSYGFIVIAIGLNIVQSRQMTLGIIHGERMSKEHYWHVFGKLDKSKLHQDYLLIAQNDLKWVEKAKSLPSSMFTIQAEEIFSISEPMVTKPNEDLTIGRFTVLDEVPTFETQFEVHVKTITSDSTQSSVLKMECVSPFNCYSWDNLEVSKNLRESEATDQVFKFNLPWIRHRRDEMQLYIQNPNNVSIELLEFRIIAHSLIRK